MGLEDGKLEPKKGIEQVLNLAKARPSKETAMDLGKEPEEITLASVLGIKIDTSFYTKIKQNELLKVLRTINNATLSSKGNPLQTIKDNYALVQKVLGQYNNGYPKQGEETVNKLIELIQIDSKAKEIEPQIKAQITIIRNKAKETNKKAQTYLDNLMGNGQSHPKHIYEFENYLKAQLAYIESIEPLYAICKNEKALFINLRGVIIEVPALHFDEKSYGKQAVTVIERSLPKTKREYEEMRNRAQLALTIQQRQHYLGTHDPKYKKYFEDHQEKFIKNESIIGTAKNTEAAIKDAQALEAQYAVDLFLKKDKIEKTQQNIIMRFDKIQRLQVSNPREAIKLGKYLLDAIKDLRIYQDHELNKFDLKPRKGVNLTWFNKEKAKRDKLYNDNLKFKNLNTNNHAFLTRYMAIAEDLVKKIANTNPLVTAYQEDFRIFTAKHSEFIRSITELLKGLQEGKDMPVANFMRYMKKGTREYFSDPLLAKLNTNYGELFGEADRSKMKFDKETTPSSLIYYRNRGLIGSIESFGMKNGKNLAKDLKKKREFIAQLGYMISAVNKIEGSPDNKEDLAKKVGKDLLILSGAVAGAIALGAFTVSTGGTGAGLAAAAGNIMLGALASGVGAGIGGQITQWAVEDHYEITEEVMAQAIGQGAMYSALAGVGGIVLGQTAGRIAARLSKSNSAFSQAAAQLSKKYSDKLIRDTLRAGKVSKIRSTAGYSDNFGKQIIGLGKMRGKELLQVYKNYFQKFMEETKEEIEEEISQQFGAAMFQTDDPSLGFLFALMPHASRMGRHTFIQQTGHFNLTETISGQLTPGGLDLKYSEGDEVLQYLIEKGIPTSKIDNVKERVKEDKPAQIEIHGLKINISKDYQPSAVKVALQDVSFMQTAKNAGLTFDKGKNSYTYSNLQTEADLIDAFLKAGFQVDFKGENFSISYQENGEIKKHNIIFQEILGWNSTTEKQIKDEIKLKLDNKYMWTALEKIVDKDPNKWILLSVAFKEWSQNQAYTFANIVRRVQEDTGSMSIEELTAIKKMVDANKVYKFYDSYNYIEGFMIELKNSNPNYLEVWDLITIKKYGGRLQSVYRKFEFMHNGDIGKIRKILDLFNKYGGHIVQNRELMANDWQRLTGGSMKKLEILLRVASVKKQLYALKDIIGTNINELTDLKAFEFAVSTFLDVKITGIKTLADKLNPELIMVIANAPDKRGFVEEMLATRGDNNFLMSFLENADLVNENVDNLRAKWYESMEDGKHKGIADFVKYGEALHGGNPEKIKVLIAPLMYLYKDPSGQQWIEFKEFIDSNRKMLGSLSMDQLKLFEPLYTGKLKLGDVRAIGSLKNLYKENVATFLSIVKNAAFVRIYIYFLAELEAQSITFEQINEVMSNDPTIISLIIECAWLEKASIEEKKDFIKKAAELPKYIKDSLIKNKNIFIDEKTDSRFWQMVNLGMEGGKDNRTFYDTSSNDGQKKQYKFESNIRQLLNLKGRYSNDIEKFEQILQLLNEVESNDIAIISLAIECAWLEKASIEEKKDFIKKAAELPKYIKDSLGEHGSIFYDNETDMMFWKFVDLGMEGNKDDRKFYDLSSEDGQKKQKEFTSNAKQLSRAKEVYGSDLEKFEIIYQLLRKNGPGMIERVVAMKEYISDVQSIKLIADYCRKTSVDNKETVLEYIKIHKEEGKKAADKFIDGLIKEAKGIISPATTNALRAHPHYMFMIKYVFPDGYTKGYFERALTLGDATEHLDGYEFNRNGEEVSFTGLVGYELKEGEVENPKLLEKYSVRMKGISDFIEEREPGTQSLEAAFKKRVNVMFEERALDEFKKIEGLSVKDKMLIIFISETIKNKEEGSTYRHNPDVVDLAIMFKYTYHENYAGYVRRSAEEVQSEKEGVTQNYLLWIELANMFGENVKHILRHDIVGTIAEESANYGQIIGIFQDKISDDKAPVYLVDKHWKNVENILSDPTKDDDKRFSEVSAILWDRVFGQVNFKGGKKGEAEEAEYKAEFGKIMESLKGNMEIGNLRNSVYKQLINLRNLKPNQWGNLVGTLNNERIPVNKKFSILRKQLLGLAKSNLTFRSKEEEESFDERFDTIVEKLEENLDPELLRREILPKIGDLHIEHQYSINEKLETLFTYDYNKIREETGKYDEIVAVDKIKATRPGEIDKTVVASAKRRRIRSFFMKSKETALCRNAAFVCIGNDPSMWKDKDYFEMVMKDEETGKFVGLTMLKVMRAKDGKKYLSFNPNPTQSFLGNTGADKVYKYMYNKAVAFAKANGFDGITITSNEDHIYGHCTNRSGRFVTLLKNSRLRDKKGNLRIVDYGEKHMLGGSYGYTDGALIWEKK